MGKIKLILGASILLLVSVQVNASLIINGGFEDPVVGNQFGGFEHRNGFDLTGWESFSTWIPGTGEDPGSVHFNTNYAPVSEGNQAVQIEVPGDWISQSFATVIGQEYGVSFDLSAYPVFGGPNLGRTRCNPYCDSIIGVSVGSASDIFTGSSASYVTNTLLFTAITSISTLKFENLYFGDGLGNYPHVDNVSVSSLCSEFPGGGATGGEFPGGGNTGGCFPGGGPSPVPAPPAIWLFGTGLIGLIGFSKRRKAS